MTVINDLYMTLFGRSGTNKGTDIEMAEHGRQGGVSTGQPFKFTDELRFAMKMTESGDYTYIAYAPAGTAESAASWQCFRIDEGSGFKITWADSNVNFDNVATDLTALSYS